MPKVIREKKIVELAPVELPGGLKTDLKDPGTMKSLITADEEGIPHAVYKNSMILLEDGCMAYMELIEGSQTLKNMLRNYWSQKPISVLTFNGMSGRSYQIKCIVHKYVVEGKLWDEMLKAVWEKFPTVEPPGIWIMIPFEVRDESYDARFNAENERLRPSHRQWFTYKDASYSRRYKTGQYSTGT